MSIDYRACTFYLFENNWSDYDYRTTYNLKYCDAESNLIYIGRVKIGERGMGKRKRSPSLPSEFEKLEDNFFSISESEDYYRKASVLEGNIGYEAILALNDFVLLRDVYKNVQNEDVVVVSLLRGWVDKLNEDYMNRCLNHLFPPINLGTMRRIYGSTGWENVDKALIEMQRLLSQANLNLYYNAIATIGRETISWIANTIYDDELHRDKNAYPCKPNKSQYVNKLCGFIDYAYDNKTMTENIKNYLKSTIELVNGYVHKADAEHYECFMCVHSVISLVFQLSIIYQKERYNKVNH